MKTQSVELTIETDGGPISVLDLQRYLRGLRAAYVHCLRLAGASEVAIEREDSADHIKALAEVALERAPHKHGWAIHNLARVKLDPEYDLVLLDISRENPLRMVLAGASIVIIGAAVVISGGEIEVTTPAGGLKVKAGPLGDGIAKLRAAFSEHPNAPPSPPPQSTPKAGP